MDKVKRLILSAALASGLLLLLPPALRAQGQCQTCSAQGGGCVKCVGATTGGYVCSTFSCTGCTIQFSCSGSGGRLQGACTAKAAANAGAAAAPTLSPFPSPVKIDAATIRAIAARHPRFALTFVMTNDGGGLIAPWAEAHWLPVPLTAADVERALSGGSAFTSSGPEAAPPESASLVYRLDIKEGAEEGLWWLQLEQVGGAFEGDPNIRTLEMALRLHASAAGREWRVESWQMQ